MADLGSDISGIADVDAALSVATGRTALAQAILRRLGCPRGGNFDDPTYGFALALLIGSNVPISVIEQRVLEQVLAEEEVADARVDATLDASGTLQVTIDVKSSDGPFTLTVTQTELTLTALLDGSPLLLAA